MECLFFSSCTYLVVYGTNHHFGHRHTPKDHFSGYYEYHGNDVAGRGTNNWHYVTIRKSGSRYIWRNAAAVEWSLYPRSTNILRVGGECPYFRYGYTVATFKNGGVQGPGGFYQNEGIHYPQCFFMFRC